MLRVSAGLVCMLGEGVDVMVTALQAAWGEAYGGVEAKVTTRKGRGAALELLSLRREVAMGNSSRKDWTARIGGIDEPASR